MGANMARRLKDRGFHVTAVYDTNRAAATVARLGAWLRGRARFVGSHGSIRRDLHRGDGRQRDAANLFRTR